MAIPDNAMINMESYMNPVFTVLDCCGRGVKVIPRIGFDAVFDDNGRTTDDWGRRVKRCAKQL